MTERTRAEAAVQALNRTLEARVAARTRELSDANRELESFAYSVSHDLRAPLRGIEGFSRLLEERHADALDETGRDYLARVRGGTARMGELIDALLKLARIRRSEPELAAVDVSALAEEVAAGLVDANPGHAVQLRIQPGMTARADRALLRNLLDNLLGNAWKFTRDGRRAGGHARLARRARRDVVRDPRQRRRLRPGLCRQAVQAVPAPAPAGGFPRPRHWPGLGAADRGAPRRQHPRRGRAGPGARFRFTLGDDDDADTDVGEPG